MALSPAPCLPHCRTRGRGMALFPVSSRPSPLNAYLASSRRLGLLLYCYAPPTVLASGVGGVGGGDLDFEIQTMALSLASAP